MPSTISLAHKLAADYPQFTFASDTVCRWSPASRTIAYTADTTPAELLHELGHALLDHRDFSRDIELLGMERAAWERAVPLAEHYTVSLSLDTIEDALDTYRDWLHARSLCPACNATGIQTQAHRYKCLACLNTWRVNDARHCALRRYTTKHPA